MSLPHRCPNRRSPLQTPQATGSKPHSQMTTQILPQMPFHLTVTIHTPATSPAHQPHRHPGHRPPSGRKVEAVEPDAEG